MHREDRATARDETKNKNRPQNWTGPPTEASNWMCELMADWSEEYRDVRFVGVEGERPCQ
jgi:hypothetical protein